MIEAGKRYRLSSGCLGWPAGTILQAVRRGINDAPYWFFLLPNGEESPFNTCFVEPLKEGPDCSGEQAPTPPPAAAGEWEVEFTFGEGTGPNIPNPRAPPGEGWEPISCGVAVEGHSFMRWAGWRRRRPQAPRTIRPLGDAPEPYHSTVFP